MGNDVVKATPYHAFLFTQPWEECSQSLGNPISQHWFLPYFKDMDRHCSRAHRMAEHIPSHSQTDTLIPNVMVFGGEPFGRWLSYVMGMSVS